MHPLDLLRATGIVALEAPVATGNTTLAPRGPRGACGADVRVVGGGVASGTTGCGVQQTLEELTLGVNANGGEVRG